MYRHHRYWGGGGWGGGWGGSWGGWGMRRRGFPLFGGGFGMGGGGLLGDLMAGGLGYMVGRQQAQNQQYQQPAPQYQPQYQQPAQQYQQPAPQYQTQPAQGAQQAQLRLLGQLREKGMLTNDEFEREKQQILKGF